ncbi:hypothetical protein HED48_04440 [Ochrobactrum intermedium]|nr:hypothetical protein [Brucella intermedia]
MPAGKPLIIIIDQHTRSAAEVMSYVAKRDKLALLVGSRTAGAVAGGSLFPLPDGGGLYVAVQALRTDGHVLEGQGVVPDVIVEGSLPYAGGADPQLDRALEEAEKKPENDEGIEPSCFRSKKATTPPLFCKFTALSAIYVRHI